MILGTLVGSIVTWLASSHFYRRAAQDLIVETEALRKHTQLILRSLEEAGFVELARDQEGHIAGIVFDASGSSGSQSSETANSDRIRNSE